MKIIAGTLVLLCALFRSAHAEDPRVFLIGNSLTWDTVPSRLAGNPEWHVDCGKSLPYIFDNPAEPCVKSSTLWPSALHQNQYDLISLQVHYGSILAQDTKTIGTLIQTQPGAIVIVHTGWARAAERKAEWNSQDHSADAPMTHSRAYFEGLIEQLKRAHPDRKFRRTRSMDLLELVAQDIEAGRGPFTSVDDLYRDAIHMDLNTGRYLMHNAMRHAAGQPRSSRGFEKLKPEIKDYLDDVLNRGLID